MKIKYLIILPMIALLAGCSSGDSKKIVSLDLNYIPISKAPADSRYTQSALADAAGSVSQSMNQISAIQMASHPKGQMAKPFSPNATAMSRVVSVNWTGPMLPFVKQIASSSGYHVRVLGTTPPIPPIVNVSMKNQALAYVLRNVQYQVNKAATISVYPKTRTIEIRYLYNR